MAKSKKETRDLILGTRVTPTLAKEIAEVAELMDTNVSEILLALLDLAASDSRLIIRALKHFRRIDDAAEKQLLSMS